LIVILRERDRARKREEARPKDLLLGPRKKAGPSLVLARTARSAGAQDDNFKFMFSRKIRVEYEADGQRHPAPLKWLDSFSMRNFTNAQMFDDTLPVADGLIEIGTRVPLAELQGAMEDWFRRKSYLVKDGALVITAS